MSASLDAVIAQMHAAGMPPISASELELDAGRWTRYGPQKKAYYRIERRTSRAGREYFVGAFGYKGDGPHVIAFEGAKLSPEEILRLQRERAEAEKRAELRRSREIQRAADRAADTWRRAGEQPFALPAYLVRKDLELGPPWIRSLDGNVVVPMCRYDLPNEERLRGVQIIAPNGDKRFSKGMASNGCAAVVGMHAHRDPVLIAEGLATAASCWLALGRKYRVFVAFHAGNLAHVARIVRRVHPEARILFCADDDTRTLDAPGTVVGRVAARDAALELGRAAVIHPLFKGPREGRTDFNDLHTSEGLPAVAAQLIPAIKWLPHF